ncbi:MAG: PAS domain-containing protein, partial [Rhodospirillaceae bacterium]|nr:PAS domain-containing protein [Rhodospirillaceae bacterium]
MRIGIRSKVLFAFGVLAFIGVSNFGLLWVSEKKTVELEGWVSHTHRVLQTSESFLGRLIAAETGQRGFLLTGEDEYLEPYNDGVDKARSNFKTLLSLTSDNALQQSRLMSIGAKMDEKFSELEETINLAKRGMSDKALGIVKSNVGKETMDAIHVYLVEFQAEEQRLLKIRVKEFRAERERMRLMLAGEALSMFFLIIIIAIVVQRSVIRPVIQLTSNADKMSRGEPMDDIKMSRVFGEDEMHVLVHSFNDMSERISSAIKNLEISRVESEEKELRLSEIIWSTNVGTWEWNLDADSIDFNNRWAEMIGYKLNEIDHLNADTWRDTIHPDDVQHFRDQLEQHFSGKRESLNCETRRQCKDGTYIWTLDRGKVVEWSFDGRPIRMSGTMADVSERKAAEKAKDEFVSTVSHELRTPLTSIKGSLGIVCSGAVGEFSDKTQLMLDVAHKNTDRLILLINDILDVEKIGSGNMEYDMQPVKISELLDDAIESNKGYGDKHGVTFDFSGYENDVQVHGDRGRLLQVLSNLMSNAAKFTPQGERVAVSAKRSNGSVR